MGKHTRTLPSVLAALVLAGCQMDEAIMAPNATPEERVVRAWFSGATTQSPLAMKNGDVITQCTWDTLYSTNGVYRQTVDCGGAAPLGMPAPETGRWWITGRSLCRLIQRQGDRTWRSDQNRDSRESCGSVVISGDSAEVTWPSGNVTQFLKLSQSR